MRLGRTGAPTVVRGRITHDRPPLYTMPVDVEISPFRMVVALHPVTQWCRLSGQRMRTAAGIVGRSMRSRCSGCGEELEWWG